MCVRVVDLRSLQTYTENTNGCVRVCACVQVPVLNQLHRVDRAASIHGEHMEIVDREEMGMRKVGKYTHQDRPILAHTEVGEIETLKNTGLRCSEVVCVWSHSLRKSSYLTFPSYGYFFF